MRLIQILTLTAALAACKAAPQTSSGVNTAPSDPALQQMAELKELTAAEEEALIRAAYEHATPLVKQKFGGLGKAWFGNVTGSGPKCDQVHDAYQPLIRAYLQQHLNGRKLNHYVPVTVFDSGWAPADLTAHVYMGIGTQPKKIGEKPTLISWTDPWRYGNTTQYKPGTGPNSPDDVIPSF